MKPLSLNTRGFHFFTDYIPSFTTTPKSNLRIDVRFFAYLVSQKTEKPL